MEASQMVEGEVVNGSAIVVAPRESALELHNHARDVAGVCKDIVTRTAKPIQGKRYIMVEGWMSIASAYGLVAGAKDVERVPGGMRATGELRKISDGSLVCVAEGFVGEDEPVWFGGRDAKGKEHPKRPDFAIRAMAQTRAISRACRSALAFVVVMMEAGLSTTPAEEMLGIHGEDAGAGSPPIPPPAGTERLRQQLTAKPMAGAIGGIMDRLEKLRAPNEPPPHTDADQPYEHADLVKELNQTAQPPDAPAPNYGKGKGMKLSQLELGQLQYYADGCMKTISNPEKAQWHEKEKRLLATIQAWVQFRS